MKHLVKLRHFLTALCVCILTSNLLVQPISAAMPGPQGMAGQLTFTRQVSINGTEASAGQTVFNGSRIKVGPAGTAVLNLGALGRVELGAGAEFALRLGDKTIGGELAAGCMNLSAPSGVSVTAIGRDGAATADGAKPTAFWMGYKDGQMRVAPSLGDVRLMAGAKTGAVRTGEVATLATSRSGERTVTNRSAAEAGGPGAMCACAATTVPRAGAPGTAKAAAPSTPNGGGGGFGGLGLLGISLASGVAGGLIGSAVMNGGLTCVNGSGFGCRPVSPSVP